MLRAALVMYAERPDQRQAAEDPPCLGPGEEAVGQGAEVASQSLAQGLADRHRDQEGRRHEHGPEGRLEEVEEDALGGEGDERADREQRR